MRVAEGHGRDSRADSSEQTIERPFFQTRNMLHLTAKSTQFGHRTFTSWLIESAGTVPIKRHKDFNDKSVDNSEVMEKLIEVRRTCLIFFRV